MSGRPLHQCWRPSHHHSSTEASRSGADPAQALELVLAVALGAPELEEAWELEEMAALELVLVAVEDPQMASHTSLPCTSVPCRIANQGCTSSHTGGTEYHTVLMLHVHLRGNQLGTQHRKFYTSWRR
jgi:hypothetical protein